MQLAIAGYPQLASAGTREQPSQSLLALEDAVGRGLGAGGVGPGVRPARLLGGCRVVGASLLVLHALCARVHVWMIIDAFGWARYRRLLMLTKRERRGCSSRYISPFLPLLIFDVFSGASNYFALSPGLR